MFERILLPLDGSPGAERAIPAAARIARAFGSTIIILGVVVPQISPGTLSLAEEDAEARARRAHNEASTYLEAISHSIELHKIITEVHALTGAVAPTILSAAQPSHADLVVLCRHSSTGFRRWSVGSVAEKVIHHAPIPVFVLPEAETESATPGREAVHALVALDGSPLSEEVVEPAASLAAGLSRGTSRPGVLQLMRVVDIPAGSSKFSSLGNASYDAQMRTEAKRECEQYLQSVAKRFAKGKLAKYRLEITTDVVTGPDVAESIVQTAEQWKVDFTAMATHGRGGLQQWTLGSITDRVLHTTRAPLFIVRSRGD